MDPDGGTAGSWSASAWLLVVTHWNPDMRGTIAMPCRIVFCVCCVLFLIAGCVAKPTAVPLTEEQLSVMEPEQLTPLAQAGDVRAQKKLGAYYTDKAALDDPNTILGKEDASRAALFWYGVAAQAGDVAAIGMLGYLYAEAPAPVRDPAKALAYTQEAAERGLPFAQNNLGSMYKRGEATPVDYALAIHWFQKAADQNWRTARANLGRIYLFAPPPWRDQAKGLAILTGLTQEEGGAPELRALLAQEYRFGNVLHRDKAKSRYWEEQAAEVGYPYSMLTVADWYRTGKLPGAKIAPDYVKAAALYLGFLERFPTSKRLGNEARFALAGLYFEGKGVARDYTKAREFYIQGRETGLTGQEYRLGYMYEHGLGTERDIPEAMYWYREAGFVYLRGGVLDEKESDPRGEKAYARLKRAGGICVKCD